MHGVNALALFLLLGAPALGASTSTLVICDDVSEPATLDPHKTFDNKTDDILFQIYERLLRLGPEGEVQPALATSCRRIDPLTLRCDLRRGVTFHDGSPFDAEAVRWSLERELDPKTGDPAAFQLAGIESVRVVAPYAVEIRTKTPDGLLERKLASFGKIASPKAYERLGAERFAAEPIGTGPFRFVSWKRGEAIRLTANADYWAGVPEMKDVVFRFVPAGEQLDLLFKGSLDLVTDPPATRTAEIAARKTTKVVKRRVWTTPAFWFTSFDGPLADKRVRQALNLAVNKARLIRYAAMGNGVPIGSLSMEGEFGRDGALRPFPYEPRRARLLLAEASYPKGFEIPILASAQAEREARIVAEEWSAIGVRASVEVVPLAELGRRFLKGPHGFGVAANAAPDPAGHVYFLPGVCFYSRSFASRFRSAEFDALYERMAAAEDAAEQAAMGRRLDDFIHDEALGVFTYQSVRTYAMSRRLSFSIPVTGILDLREAHWER